ncbi:hypothetical protein CRG98_010227 [Punica granatum]|uniref:Uncharacterized protein n=1 Tax=Punica granatum TaxID=22663 RepID=A0A2I0KLV2_PUNGR|nr:hypothetical protein CRG98_010227 [Punica granatum]
MTISYTSFLFSFFLRFASLILFVRSAMLVQEGFHSSPADGKNEDLMMEVLSIKLKRHEVGDDRDETPFRKSFGKKLDAPYEVSYLSDDYKIYADLPLINPCIDFSKSTTFLPIRSIQHLIRQSTHHVEEDVQSTRVHNHEQNLSLEGSKEALMILVDSINTPTCVHIPRQITRQDLVKLLPNKWITDYECLHQSAQPI